MSGQQNSPRSESLGLPDEFPLAQNPTPCGHLAEAAEWLAKAKRTWNGESEAAARIAQLHIELADRIEMLGACDE